MDIKKISIGKFTAYLNETKTDYYISYQNNVQAFAALEVSICMVDSENVRFEEKSLDVNKYMCNDLWKLIRKCSKTLKKL